MYRRIKRPIFVACEGKSELGYIRWLNRLAGARDVPIAISGRDMKGGDPEKMACKAVRVLQQVAGGPTTYLRRYLLLDCVRSAEARHKMERARRIAEENTISLIWQPICHECFLIKHFAETEDRKPPTAIACEATLRGVWPAYRKGLDATEYEKQLSIGHLSRARANLPDLDAFLKDIDWN